MSVPAFDPRLSRKFDQEALLQDAVFAFNVHSRVGALQLCKAYGLQENERNIAHLLHTVDGLIGKVIGEYLSKKEESESE